MPAEVHQEAVDKAGHVGGDTGVVGDSPALST